MLWVCNLLPTLVKQVANLPILVKNTFSKIKEMISSTLPLLRPKNISQMKNLNLLCFSGAGF
jgi:hypothetical protein